MLEVDFTDSVAEMVLKLTATIHIESSAQYAVLGRGVHDTDCVVSQCARLERDVVDHFRCAVVAMDSVSDFESGGCGFESRIAYL